MKKWLKPTASLNAYDFYLKGQNDYYQFNHEGYINAIKYYNQALELDPNYTIALAAKSKSGITFF